MIKECKIVLHNSVCVVVDCDGTNVQFPYMENASGSVYVDIVGSKYSIVSKRDYDKALAKAKIREKKEATSDAIEEFSE